MAGAAFQALVSDNIPIGIPVSIGGVIGSASASTVSLSTTAAVPAGGTIFVISVFGKPTTISVQSITDGAGNTYALAKSGGYDAVNFENEELWYAANVAALPAGSTILVTFTATSTALVPIMAASYCTGLAAVPLDKTNSTLYTPGTAFSSGATGVLTLPKELIIGAMGFYNAACTVTEGSGFTQIVDQDQGSGVRARVHMAYQIVNATTTVNYQPSLSAANFGASIVASFKGVGL